MGFFWQLFFFIFFFLLSQKRVKILTQKFSHREKKRNIKKKPCQKNYHSQSSYMPTTGLVGPFGPSNPKKSNTSSKAIEDSSNYKCFGFG
jgi:hypothetical protein